MEVYLEDYNQESSITMPLVMFGDACEHVARICRILRQPEGNALLLGVGGSGRQSLSRLASFISEYFIYQIEVMKGYGMNEFKEDLRQCLMKCGNELRITTFLFADTQIVKESMVEAINNILNSGDVPNLYNNEELDQIAGACRLPCQAAGMQPTKSNIFSTFVARVKSSVHVVLAFSPVGDTFRTRLRLFPSLVSCCTINWFAEWPADALCNVGRQQLTIEDLKLENLEGILDTFIVMHQSVEASSTKIKEMAKRIVYITPTSFLELITSFKKVLQLKREEVGTLKNRLQKGLDRLLHASMAVATMENELKAQPKLVQTQKEVKEMMVVINEDKAKASVKRASCQVVEDDAKQQAEQATEIKEDAQRDLDEALPALKIATTALQALKLSNIQEVRSLQKPPDGVRLTLEAICIMLDYKPIKKPDPTQPGKRIDDYWEASQKGPLQDPAKLLNDLYNFDKDNIPEAIIRKMQPYNERDDFDPAVIKKASLACEALCLWCRAMYKYHFVAKAVAPKRLAHAKAEAELQGSMQLLEGARKEVKEVEDKIQDLESKYNAAVRQMDELAADIELCAIRLTNAQKLIEGLGGEKERWQSTVAELTQQYGLLTGDALLAGGMVGYAGPFTAEYRAEFEKLWRNTLVSAQVSFSPGATLSSVLGKPVTIQQWAVLVCPMTPSPSKTASSSAPQSDGRSASTPSDRRTSSSRASASRCWKQTSTSAS
eukprot:NODE_850_length_2734_cov_2.148830.p1 GENE.NODE_850_length_2734_cov_2.148830~~NODE_850_length_2734_cov_2.148830.p1  ORF type:complete len:719 (-),score=245.98 NODE_850_length_2734_cov_2.148830:576-2732(-)